MDTFIKTISLYAGSLPKIYLKMLSWLKIAPQDILIAFLATTITLSFISVSTYLYFANDLTTKNSIMNYNNTGIILLDSENRPFFKFYEAQYKEFIPLSEISEPMQQAIIASEDKEFYEHAGFSIKSMIAALIADIRTGNTEYGGSTITQQLVKNSLLHPQKDFLRKYQELVLAQEIERKYTKDQILEMYLNSVYFGEGAFGVEAAAQTYFGLPAKQLNLAQSSMLAGIINAPGKLSPVSGSLEKAKERQNYVLEQMVSKGYIAQAQKEKILNQKLTFSNKNDLISYNAPHFALMVKNELIEKYGEEKVTRSGFIVKTTLNTKYQDYTEQVVADQVNKLRGNRVSNGAAVVMNPKTGEILALVGSKSWNNDSFGKVNIAEALRQPGSAFKPIVYAAALERRLITPATILNDSVRNFAGRFEEPYIPHNYDDRTRGHVIARRALANSLNIPSVEIMSKVGVKEAIETAEKLGITTLNEPSRYGYSLVLGAAEVKLLDLTSAYSVFANSGHRNKPTLILEIKDKNGENIYKYSPDPQKVLDENVAFLISSILSDSQTRKEIFGNALDISFPAAVKTGTTENYKDSLTVGYTPNLTIGVWVGNNDGTKMDNIAGSLGAAPIWKQLMEHYLNSETAEKFNPPPGVSAITVCRANGMRLVGDNPGVGYTEYFLKGTEPTGICFIQKPIPPPEEPKSEDNPPPAPPVEGEKLEEVPPPEVPQGQSPTQEEILKQQEQILKQIEEAQKKAQEQLEEGD